jgi:hypothetical protein
VVDDDHTQRARAVVDAWVSDATHQRLLGFERDEMVDAIAAALRATADEAVVAERSRRFRPAIPPRVEIHGREVWLVFGPDDAVVLDRCPVDDGPDVLALSAELWRATLERYADEARTAERRAAVASIRDEVGRRLDSADERKNATPGAYWQGRCDGLAGVWARLNAELLGVRAGEEDGT